MAARILLSTDRPGFEPAWRPAFEQLGFEVETIVPDDLASHLEGGDGVVVDGAARAYDEDELLASVGHARARGAVAVVHLPSGNALSSIEDVLSEMCPGLVTRRGQDALRLATMVARKLDPDRRQRFEFVTVAPSGAALLAILGDGSCRLLTRPAGEDDDGSEVVSIALAEDARTAVVDLADGGTVELSAPRIGRRGDDDNGASTSNGVPIDGARLGARLRELRLAAGLTQAELARRTGIHRPNIARVEAGRHTPSLETLARLASAIGVPTTRVLSED